MSEEIKLGKYQIIKELGRGGFGIVYEALDSVLNRRVAIKVLHPTLTVDTQFLYRFQQEAALAARMEHPNIVTIHDFDQQDGRYFIVMSLMRQGSLKDRLQKLGALSTDQAQIMFKQVASGLAYAHEQGIIHRDLKPGNILIDEHGIARVADFGFAKALDGNESMTFSTLGNPMGTAAYMAPEIWEGKPASVSSDLYSLGCIGHEMLTGKALFEGESTAQIVTQHVVYGPQLAEDLPDGWRKLLSRCLMKDPNERYPSANALLEDLQWGVFSAPQELQSEIVLRSVEVDSEDVEGIEYLPSSTADPVAGGVASSVPLQGQAMDTSWQGQVRAHQPLAQGGRETGQDSSVPGQGMEATRQDELRHEREVVRFAPDAARMGRQAGTQMPVSSYGAARSETKQAIQLSKPSIGTTRSVLEARRKTVNRRFWALLIGLITILVILNPPPTVKDIGKENVPLYIEATSTFDQRHYVSTPDPSSIPSTETMPTEDSQTAVNNPEQDRRQSKTNVRWQDGMEMVYVPEGEFTMGSTDSDADDDESPVREVRLDAYWIDKYEVSNGQYQKCVNAGKCTKPRSTDSSTRSSYYGNTEYDDFPVIYVSWHQAKAYCEWAGGSLPTEAQWEKAARGKNGRKYPWGDESPNSNLVNYGEIKGDTTAVGSYPRGASPYGAMDMAGNVWEWVEDWYKYSYDQSQIDNPDGPSNGGKRVFRGGSWFNYDRDIRSANRNGSFSPTVTSLNIGFRCVSSP